MDQRLCLLEFAQGSEAWIIEDDFDSEYRFEGLPIPAMQ
jgi:GntR family transcriptional regulator/MocR family aminotransferase